MNDIKVDWLMPVKNGMPHLTDSLRSIAGQEFGPSRVLVWDNGSDDGTVEELRRWIPRVIPGQIFTDQPFGVGGALRELVVRSDADVCVRLDGDDIALPERLKLQLDFLAREPEVAAVGGQMVAIDENGAELGPMPRYPEHHVEILDRFLERNPIGHPSVAFRRAAVLVVGNYREIPNVEDYDLWLRLAGRYRLANLPQIVTRYRIHARSCTQQAIREKRLAEKMDSAFSEHAHALFGWEKNVAMRFRRREIACVWPAVRTLARRRATIEGVSVGKVLSRPSLREAVRAKARPLDLLSRTALAWYDPQPWSLLKQLLRSLKQLVYILPGIGHLGGRFHDRLRWWRWSRNAARRQCQIGANIFLKGRRHGTDYVHLGAGVTLEPDITIWTSPDQFSEPRLTMGDRVYVGRNTYLGVHKPISIGARTLIGAYCYIISGDHRYGSREIPIEDQGYTGAEVQIGANAWLGTYVVVLPGASIGEGAIIGAGSVVTKNVPPWEIWAGVPAKKLRDRP